MSTIEERRKKLNNSFAEIDKVYEDNIKESEKARNEIDIKIESVVRQKPSQDRTNTMLILLAEINNADMGRFVNKEFSFLLSCMVEMGNYLLDVAEDLDKTRSSVNVNLPKIEQHHATFESLQNFLANKQKEQEEDQNKKETEQKKLKDLTGVMYG